MFYSGLLLFSGEGEVPGRVHARFDAESRAYMLPVRYREIEEVEFLALNEESALNVCCSKVKLPVCVSRHVEGLVGRNCCSTFMEDDTMEAVRR